MYLRKIFVVLGLSSLFFSPASFGLGEDEAEFEPNETNFKYLYNNHRVAQPDKVPWPSSYWTFEYDGMAMPDWDQKDGYRPFKIGTSPAEKWDDFTRFRTWDWKAALKGTKFENNPILRNPNPNEEDQTSQNTYYEDVAELMKVPGIRGAFPAASFERLEHSCRIVLEKDGEGMHSGCTGWYGHCNAWSAAALSEDEPTTPKEVYNPITKKRMTLSVRDQKALLLGAYMEHNILVEGTNVNAADKTNKWVTGKDVGEMGEAYSAFWDPSPERFFLIFTNYVGEMGKGVAIDRFTGDEVWNQPVSGYRILPIRKEDIHKAVKDPNSGAKVWPVTIRFKLFWADDKISEKSLGMKFDIFSQTKDDEEVEEIWKGDDEYFYGPNEDITHYDGRLLKFKLFFDSPLKMKNPTTVAKAGSIVGGIWEHQEDMESYTYDEGDISEGDNIYQALNHTHPDFIWSPVSYKPPIVYNENTDVQRNPYFNPVEITKTLETGTFPASKDQKRLKYRAAFRIENLNNFGVEYAEEGLNVISELLLKPLFPYYLGQRNIKTKVDQLIHYEGTNRADIELLFKNKKDSNRGFRMLKDLGFEVKRIKRF